MSRSRWLSVLCVLPLSPAFLAACTTSGADEDGDSASSSSGATMASSSSGEASDGGVSDGATESDPTAASSGSSAGSSTGDSGAADTGGLPDYSDSPCWGMTATTTVYNGQTHQTEQLTATCRAEGEHTFVYVADELWGSTVDQEVVNGFMHGYELFTPQGSYNPEQGIVVNDQEVFGSLEGAGLPDGKVAIFVINTQGAGDGYLCGWCSYPQLHLDGNVLTPLDGEQALSIAAHETYHIIHRSYDNDEDPWMDESLAEAAMTVNGYLTDIGWLNDFRLNPDQDWGMGGFSFGDFNYGAGLLWGTFLLEHGGPELMAAITAEPSNGWAGLDAALAEVGDSADGWSLYMDMAVSMVADAPDLGWGFTSFEVGEVGREGDLTRGQSVDGSVVAGGIDVYRIPAGASVSISVTATSKVPVGARAFQITTEAIVDDPTGRIAVLDLTEADGYVVVSAQQAATYTIEVQ